MTTCIIKTLPQPTSILVQRDFAMSKLMHKTKNTRARIAAEFLETPNIITRPPCRPTQEQIAQRAFQIYVRNGCRQGMSEQDWYQAEKELTRD